MHSVGEGEPGYVPQGYSVCTAPTFTVCSVHAQLTGQAMAGQAGVRSVHARPMGRGAAGQAGASRKLAHSPALWSFRDGPVEESNSLISKSKD